MAMCDKPTAKNGGNMKAFPTRLGITQGCPLTTSSQHCLKFLSTAISKKSLVAQLIKNPSAAQETLV